MNRKSTMVEFVEELEKLPKSPEVDMMIEEAKAGEYHDFKNKKYLCGKLAASAHLRKFGHPELALRIENGEFDEEADEEDIEMMRQDIDAGTPELSEEQRSTFKKLFGL